MSSNIKRQPNPPVAELRLRPHARIRLFCFPYAGGSSQIFRNWSDSLSQEIEVCLLQLPGRGNRIQEPAHTGLDALVQDIFEGIIPYLSKPFAFFGHSMGGVFAPLVAEKTSIKGIIAYGAIGSNFLEYLVKTRKTIAEAYQLSPEESDDLVKDFCECAVYYFAESMTTAEASKKKTSCADYLSIFDLRSRGFSCCTDANAAVRYSTSICVGSAFSR